MQGLKKSKKAQANGAVGSIITLTIGVGVAVLVLIFIGSLGGQTYNLVQDDIDAVANNQENGETFTATQNVTHQLAHNFVQSGTLAVYNVSNGFQFALTNFTIDYDDGALTPVPTAYFANNSALAANYTWGAAEVRNSARGAVMSSFSALETTGDYVPLIVLAVVIVVVLGMVLGFTVIGGGMTGRGPPGL